jgi:biopolymer transport protein ExbD
VVLMLACQGSTSSPSARSEQSTMASGQTKKVGKIKVSALGDITFDGQPVTLEQLGTKLGQLKQLGGEVWYHRERPSEEPHPNAMKVMELVADNKLPIKLSAKSDFSDSVDR